jgi:dihydrofolate reductase
MKKVILDLAVTLDGFIEGPNGETDWCILDDDMGFDTFLAGIDTIFYGRVSYDLWGNFQPGAGAPAGERDLWSAVHSKRKVVFSRRPNDNSDTLFICSDIAAHTAAIKKEGGGDIWLYGGAKLITAFIQLGLIDRYRLSVHPVVLGSGKPLFAELKDRLNLRLTGARTCRSGVVQLTYEPK